MIYIAVSSQSSATPSLPIAMSSKVAILNQPLNMPSGKLMDASGSNEPTPLTSTMKIRDEVLTCRLCSERFRLSDKRPLALRCMHTFCEECLGARCVDNSQKAGKGLLVAKKTSHQIVCPVCETRTPLGKETDSYRRLPVNPSIVELLKILEQSPVASTGGRHGALVSGSSSGRESESNSSSSSWQQQQQQHQQQQSSSIVAADQTVPVAGMRHTAETRAHVKSQARKSGASIAIGSVTASERQTDDGTPLTPTRDADMISSTLCLVSTVSVGASGVMKPINGAPTTSDQLLNQRDNAHVSSGAVANQPTSTTQTSLSTSVHVGAPPSTTYHHSTTVEGHRNQATESASSLPIVHQLCAQCRANPARVTVASASKMTSLQLCSDCAKPAKKTVVQATGSGSHAVGETQLDQGGDVERSRATIDEAESEKPKMRQLICDVKSSHVVVGPSRKAFGSGGSPTSASVPSREKSDAVFTVTDNRNNNADNKIMQLEEESRQKTIWSTRTSDQSREVLVLNRPPGDADAVNGRDGVGNSAESAVAMTSSENDRSAIHNTQSDAASGRQFGGVERDDDDGLQIQGEAVGASMVNESIPSVFETLSIRSPSPMHSSAPSMEDIYPPPCENPPFNPDYRTLGRPTATGWQQYGDAPSVRDGPYGNHAESHTPTTPPPAFQEKDPLAPNIVQINGHHTSVPGRNIELSFAIPSAVPTMPEQPPRYEEVVTQSLTSAELNRHYPGIGAASAPPAATVDVMPTYRGGFVRPSHEDPSTGSYPRLVRSFGRYSENSTQPAAFRAPTRISSSEPLDSRTTTKSGELQLVVTDRANATVQVFSPIGECLSMLHVKGVSGCCLWNRNRRLVVATDEGVQVPKLNTHTRTHARTHTHIYICIYIQ